ncbi:transcriptional regulator, AraC family [Beutenbergia cavernae DSM 12333]|uniref:Transcriptional regulator, AraC family n=1 Tax=Beutenbergia cavernae (strain ATCC BAA-8 / DSM 12333 / CCUG 43141 / JCM 11478 / NBRC 16432 / NCIMB 13614 / HKI 0122) TaxID=471853 RepID=C5C1L5_BEUC1|nr:AraC family transcriptional regulator [Beutenbergia cavernae]ACQ79483.1 transcriptional regulator, AraC family [Beutenbergia cavernae DSM 12333]
MSRAEVFADVDYPVTAQRLRVTSDVPAHTHDFVELTFVIDGAAEYVTRTDRRPIGRGDVLAVRPGTWHAFSACRRLEAYNVYIGQELLRRDLAWVLDDARLARLLLAGGDSSIPLPESTLEAVAIRLDELAGVVPDGVPGGVLRRSLLGCALGELLVSWSTPSRIPAIDPAVARALTSMTDDVARAWTVAELAAVSHVSVSHLHRRFSDQLGTTPMGWLAGARAERAAVLLVRTAAPVAAVGRAVGWSDPNYASRRFRGVYGMTPTEYRRRYAFGPAGASRAGQ